jgi:hypothetical protein
MDIVAFVLDNYTIWLGSPLDVEEGMIFELEC